VNGERRFALARLVGSAILAAGLTLLIFTNRSRLLAALGDVALLWLPAVGILALALRFSRNTPWSERLARKRTSLSMMLFFASAAVAWSLSSRGGRLTRHIVEFMIVWLPVLFVVYWRAWLRRWRDLVAAAVSFAAVVAFLWTAGPGIMRRWILPQYTLDLDHRPRPNTDQTNEDGVYTLRPASAFTSDGFNVICIGDSFTANPHLIPEERFPDRLETFLRRRCPTRAIHVANFGWVSSSPVLQARRLREVGSRYHPTLVIQAIDMTDFHDDLRAAARIGRPGPGHHDIPRHRRGREPPPGDRQLRRLAMVPLCSRAARSATRDSAKTVFSALQTAFRDRAVSRDDLECDSRDRAHRAFNGRPLRFVRISAISAVQPRRGAARSREASFPAVRRVHHRAVSLLRHPSPLGVISHPLASRGLLARGRLPDVSRR
jgi:hypothetical protein